MARSRRRREAAAILLVSVVAHGALLVWLIKSIPRAPQTPAVLPFQVSLVPDLQRTVRAEPETWSATAEPANPRTVRPAATSRGNLEPPSQPAAPSPAPIAALPQQPAGEAAGAASTASSAPGPDEDAKAAVRRALRATLGCAHPDFAGLTTAERDDCSRQLGRQAAIGAQENMERLPEAKRVYYAKVQKAYQDIRDVARYGTGALPGHGPSVGCRLPFGIPKGWKSTRPPHSLKLGPLPCFIMPPQGILTPEVDLPTP